MVTMTSTGSPSKSLDPAEATAVLMVRQGMPLDEAARVSGLTPEQISQAKQRADANRASRPVPQGVSARPTARVTPPPVAPASKPRVDGADLMDIEELLAWADGAGVNRAGMLAERIRAAAEELRAMAKRRGEIDEHKSKIAQLEAALAKERAALAEASGGRVGAGKSTATAPKGETAKIRAWALENGYEVRPLGLIAKPVVEAYRRAHGVAGAS